MAKKDKTVTPKDTAKEPMATNAEAITDENAEISDGIEGAVEVVSDTVTADTEAAVQDTAEADTEAAIQDTAEEDTEAAVQDTAEEDTEAAVQDTAEEMPIDGSPEEDASRSDFMNIEHFADYRRKNEIEQLEQSAELTDEEKADAGEEIPADVHQEQDAADDEFREYENITILDELEEEADAETPTEEYKLPKDEEPYDEKKPRKVDVRFDFIELFVYMMVIVMLISTFIFRHSVVDGGSMESTLYDGEHLIISNFFYKPKQYDIIVCEDYTTGLKKPIIKRVIATEGQTVRVVAMDEVYVDGVPVDTSFILIDGNEDPVYANVYPIEYVVPDGEVFVMGDHRNSSLDSRIIGTVDEDTILGKVVLRFYPFDRFGKVE